MTTVKETTQTSSAAGTMVESTSAVAPEVQAERAMAQAGVLMSQAWKTWQGLFTLRSDEVARWWNVPEVPTTAQAWPFSPEAWLRMAGPMPELLAALLPSQDERWSRAWREGLDVAGQWQRLVLQGMDAQLLSATQHWRTWLGRLESLSAERRVSAELIHFTDRRQVTTPSAADATAPNSVTSAQVASQLGLTGTSGLVPEPVGHGKPRQGKAPTA